MGAPMPIARLLDLLPQSLRRFGHKENGVSAVEFAILLPVMLTLYLGGVEVTQAVSADRKVTLIVHSIADLTARTTNVSLTDVQNILAAGTAIASPYNTNNLTMVVSSVLIDATGKATIDWSVPSTSTATARSGDVTGSIPPPLVAACKTAPQPCSLIWGEATYTYRPQIGYVITGTLPLGDQIFMRPRQVNCVPYRPNPTGTACPG